MFYTPAIFPTWYAGVGQLEPARLLVGVVVR